MDLNTAGLFLDLRARGETAEGILEKFPPPAYFTARIDGAAVPGKAELMAALAAAFSFPSYFGRNWDALLDCLRSLPDEKPAGGYLLVIEHSDSLLASSARDREDFAEVAGDARSFLLEKRGIPFSIALL